MKLTRAKKLIPVTPLRLDTESEASSPGSGLWRDDELCGYCNDHSDHGEAYAAVLAHCWNLVMVHGIVELLEDVSEVDAIPEHLLNRIFAMLDQAKEVEGI